MLQELINLTNKAKGTQYEALFQEVYEVTVEIEAAYGEKFPTKPNKIVYFHERFTRAFVDTYGLLMQNLEETPVPAPTRLSDNQIVFGGMTNVAVGYNNVISGSKPMPEDFRQAADDIRASQMTYAEYFGLKLGKDIEANKEFAQRYAQTRSEKKRRESERVWELRNKLKKSKEEGRRKFGSKHVQQVDFAVCNVDNSNHQTWFCFPNENEPYKLSQYKCNQFFVDELNRRYFPQHEQFPDSRYIVDYCINDDGLVIVKNKQDEYYLVLINYDSDKPRDSWEMIEFRPTAFTTNNTETSYERNQIKKYITLMTRRCDETDLPKDPITSEFLWKCYVYDNLRWAHHTKIAVDSQPIAWLGTYGNRKAWDSMELFKSLVFTVYLATNENPDEHEKRAMGDLVRGYNRAIDLLEMKSKYEFNAKSHHHALQRNV